MWRTFPMRRTADERIFLAVFLLYIKTYATWCPLSQKMIVPTLPVGLTFNVCRVSQSLLPRAAKAKPTPVGPPAPASHGWLRLRRPTVCTLQRWPVPPSIPPHVLLFSGDASPNTRPCPNQSTLVLPSAYDWIDASSMATVRSV